VKVDIVAVADAIQPEWVDAVLERVPDARLRLYCTGEPPLVAPCVPTEHVGSEEYAFLKHIVDNYNELTDVTIFTPRDLPTNQGKQGQLERILQRLDRTTKQYSFAGLFSGNYLPLHPFWDGPAEACGPTIRPFGKWYYRYINATDTSWSHINCTAATLGNTFAVSADRIRRIPLSLYKGLMREVEHCRGSGSKVTGYYIERSWASLFAERCHTEEAMIALNEMTGSRTKQIAPAMHAKEPLPKQTIDLVVASYDAPLDWIEPQLAKLPGARLHLYCKGNSTDPRCIPMENVGTEEYAFLVHILRHYNDLADITIFTKDNMVDTGYYKPTALESLNTITSKLEDTETRNTFQGFLANVWFPFTEKFDAFKYHSSSSDGKVKMLCRPSLSPYGPWYKRFINPDDTNYTRMYCTAASMHGIFAVSRDRIRRIPRARFVDLLEEVEFCRGHNAFTAGHYMERSWAPLFAERCHNKEAAAAFQFAHTRLQTFWKRFENVSEA